MKTLLSIVYCLQTLKEKNLFTVLIFSFSCLIMEACWCINILVISLCFVLLALSVSGGIWGSSGSSEIWAKEIGMYHWRDCFENQSNCSMEGKFGCKCCHFILPQFCFVMHVWLLRFILTTHQLAIFSLHNVIREDYTWRDIRKDT